MEKIDWLDYKGNRSPILEAFRVVRSNLKHNMREDVLQLIEITSPEKGTDKSSVIAGLAIVLAQEGKKTLVVDGNFVEPVQHILFSLNNKGITDCIVSGTDFHKMIQHCKDQEYLDILPCGTAPAPFGDILNGGVMLSFFNSVRNEYDYILLDVSPVKESADSLAMGSKADGVILVVTFGENELSSLTDAKIKLEQSGAKIIGCILDKVQADVR